MSSFTYIHTYTYIGLLTKTCCGIALHSLPPFIMVHTIETLIFEGIFLTRSAWGRTRWRDSLLYSCEVGYDESAGKQSTVPFCAFSCSIYFDSTIPPVVV